MRSMLQHNFTSYRRSASLQLVGEALHLCVLERSCYQVQNRKHHVAFVSSYSMVHDKVNYSSGIMALYKRVLKFPHPAEFLQGYWY